MKKVIKTIVLLIDWKEQKILLGLKKVRFGAGKWNGYGGKVEPEESITNAALRELFEESGIGAKLKDLKKSAVINYYSPLFGNDEVHVFYLTNWAGDAIETEEMRPQWFSLDAIPYENMWNSDAIWLPKILNREIFTAEFWYNEDNEIIKYSIV
jgi:8-oxo-dGTP pyrophosphatase MutT (NUDIX family)